MSDLLKMLKTQNKVNSLTNGKDWVKNGFDWRLAATQEVAEAIDSFPWKWWKDGKIDLSNAKIEIVDIWHFVLSMMIIEKIQIDEVYESKLAALTMTPTADLTKETDTIITHFKRINRACANEEGSIEIADALFLTAGKIGMTFDDVKKMYFGKAVLNAFRQNHGYAEGSYKKIWDNQEDNMVMLEIINTMSYGDSFDEELTHFLGERYMITI